MERIILKPGDERLGRKSPSGRILPKLDVLGKQFDKLNMTVRALGNGYICVVPNRVAVEVEIESEFARVDEPDSGYMMTDENGIWDDPESIAEAEEDNDEDSGI